MLSSTANLTEKKGNWPQKKRKRERDTHTENLIAYKVSNESKNILIITFRWKVTGATPGQISVRRFVWKWHKGISYEINKFLQIKKHEFKKEVILNKSFLNVTTNHLGIRKNKHILKIFVRIVRNGIKFPFNGS